MTNTAPHRADTDCTVDPATDTCATCGVWHASPCAACGGRGFHRPMCARLTLAVLGENAHDWRRHAHEEHYRAGRALQTHRRGLGRVSDELHTAILERVIAYWHAVRALHDRRIARSEQQAARARWASLSEAQRQGLYAAERQRFEDSLTYRGC